MTKLLDKAFAAASHLGPKRQDELASRLLAELTPEEIEDIALIRAIDEGLSTHRVGRTEVMAALGAGR